MSLDDIEERAKQAELPLQDYATQLVFGRGEDDADYFFIGEAPGEQEDKEGEPFVGQAGKELDQLIENAGIASYYIANVVKYRPPENRDPTSAEVEAHAPFLKEQVLAVDPDVIVTLGNVATQFVLAGFDTEGDIGRISNVRGEFHQVDVGDSSFRVLPTYHPAAMLYNPNYRSSVKEDFAKLNQSTLRTFG